MFKIEITASTAIELGEKITELMTQFGSIVPAAGNEKPTTRKRANAKTDGASDGGAASEHSSPNATTLEPADANENTGGPIAADENNDPLPAAEGPSRDDALTAATKFSQLPAAQGGGSDALADVLKHFNVERFSTLTEGQYGEFIAEMDRRKAGASALS